jgi:hypothetical protein
MGKVLANQNLANVPAIDRHGSAQPAEIAVLRALLHRPASAGHALETGAAARDELAQALSGLFRAATLIVAARIVAALRCVKAYQPVRHTLQAHSIAVDHLDRTGWRGSGRNITTSVCRTVGLLCQAKKIVVVTKASTAAAAVVRLSAPTSGVSSLVFESKGMDRKT